MEIGSKDCVAELTDKTIERLLRALLLSENPRRDRAILRLFLQYGCSVRDIITILESDVDLSAGRIRWARRNDTDWVPLSDKVRRDIADYHKRERLPRCPHLFTTRLGRPLTPTQVMRIFKFLERESGLKVSPQTLRQWHIQNVREGTSVPNWVILRYRTP